MTDTLPIVEIESYKDTLIERVIERVPSVCPVSTGVSTEVLSDLTVPLGAYRANMINFSGKLYLIPFDSQEILEYNIETGATRTYDVGEGGDGKWSASILTWNNLIVGVPYNSPNVLIFDPTRREITKIDTGNTDLAKWSDGVEYAKNVIYCCPCNSQFLLKINIGTGSVYPEISIGVGVDKTSGIVKAKDGRLVIAPKSHDEITVYDPENVYVEGIPIVDDASVNKTSGLVVAHSGSIYFSPCDSKYIYKLTKEYELLRINTNNVSLDKWSGIAINKDNKIYFSPGKGLNKILQLDTVYDTFKLVGEHFPTNTDFWQGNGCLASTGDIYFTPFQRENILKLIIPHYVDAHEHPVERFYRESYFATRRPVYEAEESVDSDGDEYFGSAKMPDGNVVFIPFNGNSILKVNPFTNTRITIPAKPIVKGWAGAVRSSLNNKVYCAPYDSDEVMIIDAFYDTVEYNNFGLNLAQAGSYIDFVEGLDRKLYGIPYNSTQVLIIDPSNDTATVTDFNVSLSESEKYTRSTLGLNGKIYCAPDRATDFLVIDTLYGVANKTDFGLSYFGAFKATNLGNIEEKIIDESTVEYSIPSKKFVDTTLGPDGKIYCAPYNADCVIVIYPTEDTAEEKYFGMTPRSSCVTSNDGRIVMMPADSSGPILSIDPFEHKIEYLNNRPQNLFAMDPVGHLPIGKGYYTRDAVTNRSGSNWWRGSVLGSDGKIYSCPFDDRNILITDPDTKDIVTIDVSSVESYSMENKWSGVAEGPNNKMFFTPYLSRFVLILDMNTHELETIDIYSISRKDEKWVGIAQAFNGKMYCAPYEINEILVIDPTTHNCIVIGTQEDVAFEEYGLDNRWNGIISASNGKLYCSPSESRYVLVIDPTDNSLSYIDTGDEQPYKWSCLFEDNGKIYCSPYNSRKILVIDISDDSLSYIDTFSETQNKFWGIHKHTDGKIYFAPYCSKDIMRLDPSNGKIDFIFTGAYANIYSNNWEGVYADSNEMLFFTPSRVHTFLLLDLDLYVSDVVSPPLVENFNWGEWTRNEEFLGKQIGKPTDGTDYFFVVDEEKRFGYSVRHDRAHTVINAIDTETDEVFSYNCNVELGQPEEYKTANHPWYIGEYKNEQEYRTNGTPMYYILNNYGYNWYGAVIGNGKIYLPPYQSRYIAVFDIESKTFSFIDCRHLFDDEIKVDALFAGGAVAQNGTVYFAPWNCNKFLYLNGSTPGVFDSGATGATKWNDMICAPNGLIFASPYSNRSVAVINPLSNSVAYIDVNDTMFQGITLGNDNKLYFSPAGSGKVLVMDPNTFDFYFIPAGGGSYYNLFTASDGYIYGLNTNILRIDPINRTSDYFTVYGNGNCAFESKNKAFYSVSSYYRKIITGTYFKKIPRKFDSRQTYMSNGIEYEKKVFWPSYDAFIETIYIENIDYFDWTKGTQPREDAYKWRNSVRATTGRIYSCPFCSDEALIINPNDNSFALVNIIDSEIDPNIKLEDRWYDLCAASNGSVYCSPHNAKEVLVLNGTSYSKIDTGDESLRKWSGIYQANNGKIYCAPFDSHEVLVINGGALERIDIVDESPGKWSSIIEGPDNILYCFPYNADHILRIDPVDDTFEKISVANLELHNKKHKWGKAAVAADGKIYCTPDRSNKILIFDPETQTATTMNVRSYLNDRQQEMYESKYSLYTDIVSHSDGKLYCANTSEQNILVIDPIARKTSVIETDVPWPGKFTGIAEAYNGNVYLAPGNAPYILKLHRDIVGFIYNIEDKTSKHIREDGSDTLSRRWSSSTTMDDGRVLCAPHNSKKFMIYNPEIESCEFVDCGFETRNSWMGIAEGEKGRFYCAPFDGNGLLFYDHKLQACSEIKIRVGAESKGNWSDIIKARDGRLFCLPYNSSFILVFNPVDSSHELIETNFRMGAKWTSMAEGYDGKFYCAPTFENRYILIIDPSNNTFETVTAPFTGFSGVVRGHEGKMHFMTGEKNCHCVSFDIYTRQFEVSKTSTTILSCSRPMVASDNAIYAAPYGTNTMTKVVTNDTKEYDNINVRNRITNRDAIVTSMLFNDLNNKIDDTNQLTNSVIVSADNYNKVLKFGSKNIVKEPLEYTNYPVFS